MSFPPSLKRCRKNLDQSISARNRPPANFSTTGGIATCACFWSDGHSLKAGILSCALGIEQSDYHNENTEKILPIGFSFALFLSQAQKNKA
ncbi:MULTISPECIES: hypothetical protein [unclassified Rhizobium]|uniref:hypothetical protein n=1 Tax=unclassified Rhizobium TaxID=2613769 RepID=UPI001C83A8F8|nr:MULTISPECIES: hypothetical protein [unclassified Rhizobium]MBX5161170.1 hypothetical protein [Rhizobium sp. NZLR8]MBX5210670.1 hypothetical protein [Rhizobium sp. NZLR11]